MTATSDEPPLHLPPSDVERFQVIAQVIRARIAELNTARRSGSFTVAAERELYVLEYIERTWVQGGD